MSDSGRRSTVIILGLVVVAACAWVTARRFARPTPVPLSESSVIPENVSQVDSVWYWLEHPEKAKVRLVRVSNSKPETIADADEISGYSVSGDKIAWTDRVGKTWRVMSGPINGQKSQIWSGTDLASKPCFDGNRVLWTTTHAGPLNEISYLPALGPTITLYATGQGGGPSVVTTLSEVDGSLIAVQGGSAFVSGRHNTVVYKIELSDGKYKRVVGDATISHVAVDKGGTIFWVAGSKDTSNLSLIASVNSLPPAGSAVTNLDWVPASGVVYPTASGNYYIDGTIQPALWPVTSNDRLPSAAILPEGYAPVAVAEHSVLLRRASFSKGPQQLFTIPAP